MTIQQDVTIPTSQQELENGNRETTPAGDNLVRDFVLADLAAFAELAGAAAGRVHHDDALGIAMVDCGSPCPFGNVAHLTRPVDRDEAEQVVAALHDFYGDGSGRRFLVFSAWPTPDVVFRGRGLELGGHPPFMVRPGEVTPPTSSGMRIDRVVAPEQLEDFERTIIDAYPTPELAPYGDHPRLFGEPLLDSGWALYVGYIDGRPVATAGAYVTGQVVAVEMVSVRPEQRGLGLGGEITAAAAATEPERPSALIASDPGQPVYRRLGYLPILRQTLWIGTC